MKLIFKIKTNKPAETQKLAQIFAKKAIILPRQKQALIIALKGSLGAGKTTFVQGFAKGLQIKEAVKSPSFVILKIFELPKAIKNFNHLIHIDAYRLHSAKELKTLGFEELASNPRNIIVFEWPEKAAKKFEKPYFKIEFKILKNDKRELKFSLIK